VLREAGILNAPCVVWHTDDLKGNALAFAKAAAKEDLRAHGVDAALPASHFTRKLILEALYTDSLLASAAGVPLSVDGHVGAVIAWKNERVTKGFATDGAPGWRPTCEGALHEVWVSCCLPDFGDATWDEVLHARESAAGRDFRAMIARVAAAASDAVTADAPAADLEAVVRHAFIRELVDAVLARRASATDAMFNMATNFAPLGLGAVATAANDARKIWAESRSWVTFLDGVPRGIRVGTP
jgi:hypothetical protein